MLISFLFHSLIKCFDFVVDCTCPRCGKRLSRKDNLHRHLRTCGGGEKSLRCSTCNQYSTHSKWNLKRHERVCLRTLEANVRFVGSLISRSSPLPSDTVNVPENSLASGALHGVGGRSRGRGCRRFSSQKPTTSDVTTTARPNHADPSPPTQRNRRHEATLRRHSRYPQVARHSCQICDRPHWSAASLRTHLVIHTMAEEAYSNDFGTLRLSVHAFNGLIRDYDMVSSQPTSDLERFLTEMAVLVDRLFRTLSSTHLIRARMVAQVRYIHQNEEGEVDREADFHFSSLAADLVDNTEAWFARHSAQIISSMDNFNRQSSDFIVDRVQRVYLKLNLVENLDGQGSFKLPPKLKEKTAVVNVDVAGECFKYALLSILHYSDVSQNRCRKSSYSQWESELVFDGLEEESISIDDIPKVEKLNNLKINVHVWERGLQGVRYNDRKVVAPRTVNVLLVINSDGERHYCGIPNLSRLYYHKVTDNGYSKFFCERCCRSFSARHVLEEHYQFCSKGKLQIESLPKEKDYRYTKFGSEESPIAVVYADFECYIDPTLCIHHPAAVAMYEVKHRHFASQQGDVQMYKWIGEDCASEFLNQLDRLARGLYRRDYELTRQSMCLSIEEQAAFDRATACKKCRKPFDETKYKKVRDHCHISGTYRGALCHLCNTRLRLKRRILPVVFHNLKNYDGHILCKQAIGKMKDWSLSVIPQTSEKYMSISANIKVGETQKHKPIYFRIVFMDSFQFLSSSLATLAGNLDHLPLTQRLKRAYPSVTDSVIRRKGVFPYSYFDSLSRLQESCLPPIAAFKDDLTKSDCSQEDYLHAKKAWSEFGCRTFKDYLLAYLELDVYLLADVFEAFRTLCRAEDGLDPVHFISLPGLTYDSAFKYTGETIHLLQDIDMYRLFERGVRGGLTFVNRHRAQARLPELGNNREGNVHLCYIDENNLYGSSLCKPLPHSEFTWLSQEDLEYFSNPTHILNLEDEGDWGYLFEVDLDYPSELHAQTSDFPLAPESGYVSSDMFSPFMTAYYSDLCKERAVCEKYRPTRKLLLTQYSKQEYVVHYCILKFYLKMGLGLRKVRQGIRFRQKRWLEPYIKYNSEKRAHARNSFEKDFYKLKNNALFGKTMEDVRKRIVYRLVTTEDQLHKLESSPLYLDRDIFSVDVVGVHMFKCKVLLDKPIFAGQAVLEYSKLEMYNLYYNVLHSCPLIRQPELLGGDTDSFFLALHTTPEVKLEDIFQALATYFDSSNYPQDHSLFSTSNKAKLGCFKDEAGGRIIEEMVLLRPKMYSMKYLGSEDGIRRAKGVSTCIVRSMAHKAYVEAFEEKQESNVQMTILRSNLHTIQTVTFRKRALSAWEDKRCWLGPNSSVPHGSSSSGIPPPQRRHVALPPSGDI